MWPWLFILTITTKTFALEPYMLDGRLYIPKQNCYSLEHEENKTFVCYLYEDELEEICGYKPLWKNYTVIFKYSTPYDEVENWIPYYERNLENAICGEDKA